MSVHIDTPLNTLISFHYFKAADVAEMQGWGLRIIGDSGAFSASTSGEPIDRDAFYEWAVKWRSHLLWVASLDVIGDTQASWANWQVAPPGLVPTIHYGSSPRTIDRYVDGGADLIGLGGMVPFKSEPDRLLRWCASVMRYARDTHPHVRFHGWGVSHPTLLRHLPWWSVDSSGFAAAYRYGRLPLFDPDRGRSVAVQMDGRTTAAHRHLLARHYGVDWRDIATSHSDNRRTLVRVSMRSMQLMQAHYQQRHQVTAPASLNLTVTGPQVHYVDAAKQHLAMAGPQLVAALGSSAGDFQAAAPSPSTVGSSL